MTIELAERLIAEVRGREDELPLIQHGLMLLWNIQAANRNEKIALDAGLLDGGDSLDSLLSKHADDVMKSAAPDWTRQKTVENLFRALIEQTAQKQGIRRAQQFKELAAISNVSAQELRTIVDAFRADGVSFLTPFPPTAIKDETTIDISHEALIRCWKKIADQKDGWLKRETEDGIRWSLLLAEAKEFATDSERVLSYAKVLDVKLWLAGKAMRWCDRYGGDWELVDKLLKASLRKGKYIRLVSGFATITVIFICIFIMKMMGLSWYNIAGIVFIPLGLVFVFCVIAVIIFLVAVRFGNIGIH